MARGETKFGAERLQVPGTTAQSRRRGGIIIPRTIVEQVNLPGALAGTAANHGRFFTAPYLVRNPIDDNSGGNPGIVSMPIAGSASGGPEWQVASVLCVTETAGTDAGAVTLQIVKTASGTAKGAGTAILATPFDLKAAADTVQAGTLAALAAIQLNPGDSLALVPTGTLTAVAGLCVTVELKRI